MAHNVLDMRERLIVQEWIKKINKLGFVNMNSATDIAHKATEDLGFPINPIHIRNNARVLNIRLPYGHNRCNATFGTQLFTCECGRTYKITKT